MNETPLISKALFDALFEFEFDAVLIGIKALVLLLMSFTFTDFPRLIHMDTIMSSSNPGSRSPIHSVRGSSFEDCRVVLGGAGITGISS